MVSAALCYYVAGGPTPAPGEGRLPRYAWRDHYALLRERLDAPRTGARGHLPGARRREPARRSRGRRALGRRLHREEHHADHADVRLLGRARDARSPMSSSSRLRRSTPAAGAARSASTHVPPTRSDEPGVLDSTRCLSYWTQTPGKMPDDVMDALDDRVYGCDICQDVCPWNRGVEKRRADLPLPEDASPGARSRSGSRKTASGWSSELDRLFVPRNDPRWLRRNALVASGTGDPESEAGRAPFVDDPDPSSLGARSEGRGDSSESRGRGARVKPGPVTREQLAMVAHELRSPVAALRGARRRGPGSARPPEAPR